MPIPALTILTNHSFIKAWAGLVRYRKQIALLTKINPNSNPTIVKEAISDLVTKNPQLFRDDLMISRSKNIIMEQVYQYHTNHAKFKR